MKRKTTLFFLLGIFCLTALPGCKDKSPLLVRSWKLQDLQYSTEMAAQMRAQIETSIKEMRDNFTLTYFADGTYISKMRENELHGKWVLNWNSSIITSTSDSGDRKEYHVIELTSDKFTFRTTEGHSEVTFIMVPAK